MNIKIQLDYPKAFPWLIPMAAKEYAAVLQRAAEGQYAAYGRQYVLDDAIASGRSFKSFDISDVKTRGDRMEINLAPTGDRAQVISFIEFGRRPGKMPPRDVIITWLEDRKIIKKGERGPRVDALSFAVAKAIASDGIEPRFILEKAQRKYRPHIVRMFEAATRRLANKINAQLTIK